MQIQHSYEYAHNPYAMSAAVQEQPDAPMHHNAEEQVEEAHPDYTQFDDGMMLPAGTLHAEALCGLVSFVPYPTAEFALPEEAQQRIEQAAAQAEYAPAGSDHELVRVFIGQLPYFVTDMQLAWLCHAFGLGNGVVMPERIMKKQPCGERLPTGCVHAYCTRRAVNEMVEGMHKKLLIDDTGVWVAQDKEQFAVLDAYVTTMKRDKSMRVPQRPYDSIVVQFATSTFVPHSLAATPLSAPVKRRQAMTATPPPAYAPQQEQYHNYSPQPEYYNSGAYGNY